MIGRSSPSTGLGRIFDPPPTQPVEDELRQAYKDDAREQGIIVASADTFYDFSVQTPEPKRPLDLDRYAFQRELYSEAGETLREISVKKAAQLGVSAWLIRWAFRRADIGNTVLYIMPRLLQATEFSTMRIKPVLTASRYLRARQKVAEDASDTKRLKTIGNGYLAVRGSKSEDELVSVDADAIVLDEYDRLVQANLARVEQRISSAFSPGLKRSVSTPTFPNFGIDREHRKGDQRLWNVQCAACGKWTPMAGMETFMNVLDHETATLRCPHCPKRRPLDVRIGEYVAKYTDGDRPRSYHLPKFVVPGIDLRAILNRSKKTDDAGKRAFHNEDLGEGWQSATAGLTDDQIAAAVASYRMSPDGYRGFNLVSMGVDVAASRALNVRISEHLSEHEKRALWIGTIDDGIAPWGPMPGRSAFEILSLIMERFRIRMAVVDYMPDPRLVRAWCERHRGRAFRVQWHDSLNSVLTRPDAKGDPSKLNARYLEGLDSTVDLIRRRANLLPEDRPEGYDAHLKARVLVTDEVEEDEGRSRSRTSAPKSNAGEIRQAWMKTGPDDFLQAEAYDVIATHMMYVAIEAGALGQITGEIVPGRRPDVVAQEDAWRQGEPEGLDYSTGPDEDPVGGW